MTQLLLFCPISSYIAFGWYKYKSQYCKMLQYTTCFKISSILFKKTKSKSTSAKTILTRLNSSMSITGALDFFNMV